MRTGKVLVLEEVKIGANRRRRQMNEKNGQNGTSESTGGVQVAEKAPEQKPNAEQTGATTILTIPAGVTQTATPEVTPSAKAVVKKAKKVAKKAAKAPAKKVPVKKAAPKAKAPKAAKGEQTGPRAPFGRPGTLTHAVFEIGSRKFQTKDDLVAAVLAKMKADHKPVKGSDKASPEDKVGYVISWMRKTEKGFHKTNGGRFDHVREMKDGKETGRFKIISLGVKG